MSRNPKTRQVNEQAPPSDTSAPSNTIKDPSDWTTGGETMTGAQASYLKTLSEASNVALDDTVSKADASRRIDELQGKTGRGRDH
jgi:hypothetical protein